jgi:hypothetical protein
MRSRVRRFFGPTAAALAAVWLAGSLDVRPVSANAPPDRYTHTSDTEYDTKTRLTWQKAPDPTPVTYGAAVSYCLGLGSGWRMPTLKELQTIVDDSRVDPSIDDVFQTGDAGTGATDTFWAGPLQNNGINAAYVFFGNGFTAYGPSTQTFRVRCVH